MYILIYIYEAEGVHIFDRTNGYGIKKRRVALYCNRYNGPTWQPPVVAYVASAAELFGRGFCCSLAFKTKQI